MEPERLLELFEAGSGVGGPRRALLLLAAIEPDYTRDALADLVVGQRDLRLLDYRQRAFGEHLPVYVACPECDEELEFDLQASELRVEEMEPIGRVLEDPPTVEVQLGGRSVKVRAPTTRDLLAVADAATAREAASQLARRCIGRETDGRRVDDLSDEALQKLAGEMSSHHPQSNIVFELDCPVCGCAWESVFSIADFLWAEIEVQARRLLRDIDAIARAYGWTEPQILELSSFRRRCYLEMIEA